MPDLDRRLTALRDDLRATVPVPELDGVARRYRQRRTRRRTMAGAVVAVLAVSAVVPALRQLEPVPATGTPPPPRTTGEAQTVPFVNQVQFTDAGHGYALRTDCENDGSRCAPTLLASADLTDWEVVGSVPRPRPAAGVDHLDDLVDLMVLGPDEIAVDWQPGPGPHGSGVSRVYSDDGGRTWREVAVPTEVTDVVPSIPDGARLEPGCPRVTSCLTRTFTVVRPGSGTSAVLADPPPLRDPVPGAVPTDDGYWWVAGERPGKPTWSLAVSADAGRTWHTSATTLPISVAGSWRVVSRDGILYASVYGEAPTGEDGLLAIHLSDDGGRSWQRTWALAEHPEFDGFYGSLIAAADGTLILMAPDEAYTSSDGGRTLTPAEPEGDGPVDWTRLGYGALTEQGFALSADGLEWRRFEIPLE